MLKRPHHPCFLKGCLIFVTSFSLENDEIFSFFFITTIPPDVKQKWDEPPHTGIDDIVQFVLTLDENK